MNWYLLAPALVSAVIAIGLLLPRVPDGHSERRVLALPDAQADRRFALRLMVAYVVAMALFAGVGAAGNAALLGSGPSLVLFGAFFGGLRLLGRRFADWWVAGQRRWLGGRHPNDLALSPQARVLTSEPVEQDVRAILLTTCAVIGVVFTAVGAAVWLLGVR
jgi:hypothetical protein